MSTVAETPGRRARTRRATTSSRKAGGLLSGGVVWIVAIAALLAGVVAVNVLALRLNVELDELRRTRAELKAEIATSRAQLSSASANERIVHDAVTKLGLVEHDPDRTTNLDLEAP
jgi:cell division protein FtsL